MKIVCNIFVNNRLLQGMSMNKPKKHVKSTLALCKHPNSQEYFILLFTNQNKNGTKYILKNNIKQVLTKFVQDGKCTIQFIIPEHDLFVQCDVIQLKGFLHLLKRALDNKLSEKELSCSSMSVMPVNPKNIAPKKMVIVNRSEFPSKGLPRTLVELHINDIRMCGITRAILNLTELRTLNLRNNNIESIPESINKLPHLRELNISSNQLGKGSPNQWNWMGGSLSKTLQVLDLSHNHMTFVPNQLSKLHKLTTLNLNNNSLKTLPAGIGNLRQLKSFNASNNVLTVLPGSVKKLKLQSIDISNNTFEQCVPNGAAAFPKPLPVCSLKEYSARKTLGARLPYPPGSLPFALIEFLDNAMYCVCGRACFSVFLRSSHNLLLSNIAEEISSSVGDMMYVPIDCYFCSLKCFSYSIQARNRNPIVR